MKKNKDFNDVVDILKEIHLEFPQEPLAIHLGLATSDYSHIEDVPSDKELAHLLRKYFAEKTLDHIIPFTDIDEEEEDY